MTTRREFVAGTGAAFGAAMLGTRDTLAATPTVGRTLSTPAPAAARRDRIARIGLELYTMRAEMRKDVAATLKRVAEIGYKEVEFAGYYNIEAAKVRALLDENGMTSPSVHTAIEILESDFGNQAVVAKTIGHEWLIVPSLSTRGLTTADAWKKIAARFNALGRRAHDVGLKFAFHNHAEEPKPMADGSRPFDILVGETDPALVDFQMDLYWMIKAGGDPLAYFASNPGRFKLVHVKDGTAAPALEMVDVGAGAIDWKKIFAQHAKAGIEHYYVEHDEPKPDPFASAKASHDYLAKLSW